MKSRKVQAVSGPGKSAIGTVKKMSITVEYSFNSHLGPSELAFEISRRLGCVVKPDPGNPAPLFSGGFFGMELTLWAEQSLENDRDLNFEDYRYQLGNRTSAGMPLRPIQ